MGRSQPVLKLESTAGAKLLDYLAAAMVVALIFLTAWLYAELPESVPSHFDFKGQPTSYGPRWMIWIIPFLTLFVYVLVQWALQYPHYGNYLVRITENNARRQYQNTRWMLRWIRLILIIWLALTMISKLNIINETTWQLHPWILPLFILALFSTMIYFMVRSYRLA